MLVWMAKLNLNHNKKLEGFSRKMNQKSIQNEVEIIQQAKKVFASGEISQAVDLCQKSLRQNSNFVKLNILLSQFFQQNSEFDKMLESINALNKKHPNNLLVSLRQCECLIYSGEIREAIVAIDSLFEQAQQDHQLLSKLAELYLHCSQHEKVAICHRIALKLAPATPQYKYNLASAYLTLGEISKSAELLEEVIDACPEDFDAYYIRSTLHSKTEQNNNIQALQKLLKKHSTNSNAQIALGYSLGKEYEDIKDYPNAFTSIAMAAKKRKQSMRYQVVSDTRAMAAIESSFTKQKMSQIVSSTNDSAPIFILGLPRSGTTLVERLLSSHSRVGSLGEVNSFAFAMIHSVGSNKGKMDLIEKSLAINFEQLAARYKKATLGYGVEGEFLIDKTPLNFLYIGLIKKAFANAKIIHLKRHPLDSCFAMYKTLFRMGYPFSYSLQDLAQYYVAYHRLMAHWDELFGAEIFQLEYQQLVSDPENQVRKLLDYCSLEWQPTVLDFYKNKSPTATASAAQVRQPIYSSSVNRWQKYSEQLKPLKEMLIESGIDCE